MTLKPTYMELEQTVYELEKEGIERRQAEKMLKDSELWLNSIFNSLEEAVLVLTPDRKLVNINEAGERMSGYSRDELVDLSVEVFHVDHEHFVEFGRRIQKAFDTGKTANFDFEIKRRDGEIFPTEHTATLLRGEHGEPIGILSVIRDVTEKKVAEKAIRESEAQYRTLFENAGEAIYVAQDGMIKFHNPKTEELYGYSKEELNTQPFTHFIHEKDREMVLDRHKRRLKGEGPPSNYPFRIINKSGNTKWVELNVAEISWGSRPATLCFMTDIDDRVRAEEALRESKDSLDKAQEIAHIGNWSRDLSLNRAHWSDEMYRIFGLNPGDPAEVSFEFILSRIHPGDRERVTSVLKEAAEKKQAFDFEFRTIPIEGSERIIRNRGEVEYDKTGAPVRLFGTDQDITETRRLQGQVQETQKIEAISTLAGGIAHNFNNALTPIIGNVDLLEMAHGNDENTMKSLKDMKASGLRMAYLTSQLLAYAKGGKYNPEVLSMNDFVEDTLPLIQHTLDPAVRVETDLPLDVMDVKADSTQLQMILSAIMSNSNEAMEGPSRIKISTRNRDLGKKFIKDHPGLKPGPYVCLLIEDDGKGMDEETRERIFDPFFTTHFMGRGLGMASVYGIIRNHDGAITVDSEPGKGAVVRIYLPAISAESRVQGAKVVKQPEVELATGEGTILVIEDEEVLVGLFRQILEIFGYRVLQARTGKEAVKFAKTFDGQIDLALLDIKLPDMDGGRVYPLIMEVRPNLKVIVCSGYSIDGPARAILDAGAEGFIQKPFSISAFAEKLKEVLEGK